VQQPHSSQAVSRRHIPEGTAVPPRRNHGPEPADGQSILPGFIGAGGAPEGQDLQPCEPAQRPAHGRLPVSHPRRTKADLDSLSVLRHELLSPLTLIKSYVATLQQFSDTITDDQRSQYLKGIDSASDRIILLFQKLRDVAQLERSDLVIAQPVSLVRLVRNVLVEVQSQTRRHVIKFHPYAPLPEAKIDPDKIEEVLRNLLDNAIKYSPAGGDIHVELRIVRTDQELKRISSDAPMVDLPCLMLSVADDGIGIPEKEEERVFEKFYRVNNEMTKGTPGSGLGLYICKVIVEGHGGRIWCRKLFGQGTVFTFTIPLDSTGSTRWLSSTKSG
jgi:signal transduction histidine kinase